MKEWSVVPSPATVKAGDTGRADVTLMITNAGTIGHHFVAMPSDTPTLPAAVPSGILEGETGDVDPGTSASMELIQQPGSYVFFCSVPGHYAKGMRAIFTVS